MISPQPIWVGSMASTRERARRLAAARAPILILGEAGTGKTLIAYEFFALSGSKGRFVSDSAPGIPDSMLQGYMRGHKRGAFTGADRDSPGRIELASGGMYFLDEIGVAGSALQQLLLGFLETGTIERVGDPEPRKVDVRFIAATNENIVEAVRSGQFRADLYDRFWPFIVRVPALRDRRDEIVPLAEAFVRSFAAARDVEPPRLSAEFKELILAAKWTGNVRQLKKVCEYGFTMCGGPTIELFDLSDEIVAELANPDAALRIGELTPQRVLLALRRANGNARAAAGLLDVHKSSVYRILKEMREAGGQAPPACMLG